MNLYFIALVPPPALREEMRDGYNVKHALSSPAHITMQMPFKRPAEDETEMIKSLGHFACLP